MAWWNEFFPQSNGLAQKQEARGYLRWAALFLGELRDGLTMINMQSAFLIVSKGYSEKQAGVLFFVFGMSQFLFQTPAGYLYDYSDQKVLWLSAAAISTTLLTLATAVWAEPQGGNLSLMILIKFVQGAVTSFIPPGLNSITQGIVGATGMTQQVATNEMMNHLGTAIIVLIGSLLGVWLYPSLGMLFIVSPIACTGLLFFLNKIDPADIDHNEARGLVKETTKPNSNSSSSSKLPGMQDEYKPPSEDTAAPSSPAAGDATPTSPSGGKAKVISSQPSFNFGWQSVMGSVGTGGSNVELKADSPLRVLRDPILLTFILMCFLFHMANGTVLPLVMQTVAIGSGREGILLSGLCIIVAQIFMVLSAKVCGTYSGKHGRKPLFMIGLLSVPVRCLLLTLLLRIRGEDQEGSVLMNCFILSTQILDGVGAGVFGTMYILVTSDISGGTGRFSMTLGLTTAAMSIGGTVSGYLGEALAQDLGYQQAYFILMFLSMIPAAVYLFFMPETLPALVKAKAAGFNHMESLAEGDEEDHHDTEPKDTSYNQLT